MLKKTLLAATIGHILCSPAFADDTNQEQYHVELETMTVEVVNPFSQQVGTQKLTENQIKNRPTGNGNITELLNTNPNTRFSNTANASTSAGEISPNEVSIHGEKFYNNNFILNGMSNNDNLHPSGNNDNQGEQPYQLPSGGTQSFWVDTHLLKNVEVFDSNISAKYGQFTGGVINADLVDPNVNRASGKVFYRTTRDNWAKFHVSERDQTDFDNAYFGMQPQFTKHQYGVSVNQPINEKSALLFSYNTTTSDIPFNHSQLRNAADNTKINNQGGTEKRKNETYLLRGIYKADNGDVWKATAMYSPHELKRFKNNVMNGMFTNTGGGYSVNLEWDKRLSWAKINSYLGYKQTGNEIEHQEQDYHLYRRNATSSIVTWRDNSTTAKKGGYGKFSNQKDIITAKQDFIIPTYKIGQIDNNMIFGWRLDYAQAKYKRDNTSTLYNYINSTSVNCNNADACINNEQYANSKTVYITSNMPILKQFMMQDKLRSMIPLILPILKIHLNLKILM